MRPVEVSIGEWLDLKQFIEEMSDLSSSTAAYIGFIVTAVYLLYLLICLVFPVLMERRVLKECIDRYNDALQRLEAKKKNLEKKVTEIEQAVQDRNEKIHAIDRAKSNYGIWDKVRRSGEDKILRKNLEIEVSELQLEKKRNVMVIMDTKRKIERTKNNRDEAELNCGGVWKEIVKKEIKKKRLLCLSGIFAISIFFCGDDMLVSAMDTWNEVVYGKKAVSVSSETAGEEAEDEAETDSAAAPEDEAEADEKGMERRKRENEYTFILEEDQLNKSLSEQEKNVLFEGAVENLYTKPVSDYFVVSADEMESVDNVLDVEELSIEELLTAIADELERPFLDQMEEAKECIYEDEWLQKAPTSAQLEKLMNTRKKAIIKEEGRSYRRTIYFYLANDCQRMAKECLLQQQDKETVLYYYGMSIAYCCCALNCDTGEDAPLTDEFIRNYMDTRYKDIKSNHLYETDEF